MVAVSDITSLTDLAQLTQTVAEAALAETDEGVPDLSYIDVAMMAYDCCPALIVSVEGLDEETTNPLAPAMSTGRKGSYQRVNLVSLNVTVLRCAAALDEDGNVVVADKEAVAAIVQQDAWALWNHFLQAVREGVYLDLCADVHFDRGRPVREQGGCVGWQMDVRAELNGIIPVTS